MQNQYLATSRAIACGMSKNTSDINKKAYIVYTSMFTNDISSGCLHYAVDYLKRIPLYRYEVKLHLNEAERLRREYEHTISRVITKRHHQYLADINDAFQELIEHDLEILYQSAKRLFDKANVPHSKELAMMTQAYTMLSMSVRLNEAHREFVKNELPGMMKLQLDLFDLSPMLKHVGIAYDKIIGPIKYEPNMAEYALACDILFNKLINGEIVMQSINANKDMEDDL